NNAAFGYISLYNNTSSFNTAFGSQTLVYNTMGNQNTAVGYQASVLNTSGKSNTAIGYQALYSNQMGGGNTALGYGALYYTTGYFNVAVGQEAGISITTGSNNIDIGSFGSTGDADTIRIGNNQSAIFLAGIAGQTVGAGGSTCYVDINGKLGVFLSARRFKTDIADMGNASDTLLRLRPVTFRYKPEMKATDAPQFGL